MQNELVSAAPRRPYGLSPIRFVEQSMRFGIVSRRRLLAAVIKTFNVEQTLGGWAEVQRKHFADGGLYDQIVVNR